LDAPNGFAFDPSAEIVSMPFLDQEGADRMVQALKAGSFNDVHGSQTTSV
jgi:hypothetical protein